MYEAVNLTRFPVVQFADSDGGHPGEICLCLKSRLRLVDGSVPVEDDSLEQPAPSIGVSHADFGNALIHDSDFVFPKPAVDVVLEADYQPRAEDRDSSVSTVGFEIAAPSGDGEERLLLRKSVDVHPERWWKIEPGGETQQRRVQFIRGGFTPFHLRAEFGHGGTSSRHNRKGIGYEPYAETGTVPLCRLMPPGVERYRWDEDQPAAGFTALDPSDRSRLRFYGTTDAQWQKYRAPGRPDDFDARYYNFAPFDQQIVHEFGGGEIFRFTGFGPAPRRFSFAFPGHRMQCYAKLTRLPGTGKDGGTAARDDTRVSLYRLKVDTILVDLTNRQVDISWRMVVPAVDLRVWRVLLVIFDDTKQADADAVIRDEEAVGAPLNEQAQIADLMSVPEISAALGGRTPGSLAEMNTLMMQLLQTRMNDVVAQIQGLSGVTGRPFPSVTQIEQAVRSGGDIRAIVGRLGMGDLL